MRSALILPAMALLEVAIVVVSAVIVWFLVYCILVIQRIRSERAYATLECRAASVTSRQSMISQTIGGKKEEKSALIAFV